MGLKNIEKYSVSYAVFKYWVKFWHDKVFYRKVEYVNREKVPLNEHLIITANHQNALMDALAIEFAFYNQPVFVARSDIFSNKFIAAVLYWLKILPVYRIRDGYDSLKKNRMVFEKTVDIILNKNSFVIMPEGNHAGYRRLRQLKKGFARIAFQTEEAKDFSLKIKIIPVGIDYECYTDYRSTLLVNFGEPLEVSDYYEQYKENPVIAYNKIRSELAGKIKPLMINIESENYYELYDELRKMYRQLGIKKLNLDKGKLYDGFRVDKRLIAGIEHVEKDNPQVVEKMSEKMSEFLGILQNEGFTYKEVAANNVTLWGMLGKGVVLVLFFPVFLFGFLINALQYFIPVKVAGMIKDRQFHSSFKFVLTMLLFPLFYVIETGIFYFLTGDTVKSLLFFIFLPVSAVLSWQWYRLFRKFKREFRFFAFKTKGSKVFKSLLNLYDELISFAGMCFDRV
jgi:1-acyl-sn-glycerol-3-phosphate acyltransferase